MYVLSFVFRSENGGPSYGRSRGSLTDKYEVSDRNRGVVLVRSPFNNTQMSDV